MFPLFARGCRRAGSWGLAAASIFMLSVLVGTAAAQDPFSEPRMPVPDKALSEDQIRQLFEDALRNAKNRSNVPKAHTVKKTVRAVEDGANATLAVVIIAVGLVGVLVGLFILRRMALGVRTTSSSTLDDPCRHAYMLALEGQKPVCGSQKPELGGQKTEISSKIEIGGQKAGVGIEKLEGRTRKTSVFAERG